MLLGENKGSGKSRVLYGLIYKFLRGRQQKDNLFICDGKGERIIQRIGKYILDLPNVGEAQKKYLITSKILENLMDMKKIFKIYRLKDKSDFLVMVDLLH